MIDKKTSSSHQQQVLFEETDLLTKTAVPDSSSVSQQIIFDNNDNHSVIIENTELDELNVDELAAQQLSNETQKVINSKLPWLWQFIISLLYANYFH